jgi:regulator of sigma E protease
LVCLAGSVMNLILGFIILVILTTVYAKLIPTNIIATFPDGGAISEKLQINDEIISVNNLKIYSLNDVIYEFSRDSDKTVDMVVKRNGVKTEVTDIKIPTVIDEEGKETITLGFKIYGREKTFLSVLSESLTQAISNARLVFLSLVDLIRGHYSINELSGPIGVTTVISEAVSYGFDSLLNVLAFITINVGVFNLLPLPALDGGKIFILIGEIITRKRLNQKAETVINLIGFAFLILLMIFATYNDILKLF